VSGLEADHEQPCSGAPCSGLAVEMMAGAGAQAGRAKPALPPRAVKGRVGSSAKDRWRGAQNRGGQTRPIRRPTIRLRRGDVALGGDHAVRAPAGLE